MLLRRFCSTSSPALTEEAIKQLLVRRFGASSVVDVEDISGGCGAMFDVRVLSDEFRGLRRVQQHRLVTAALGAKMSDMHGIRISTSTQ